MIKIENKLVGASPEVREIKEAMARLKVGQSFLMPTQFASVARNHYGRLPGKFGTRSEGDQLRIGRIA